MLNSCSSQQNRRLQLCRGLLLTHAAAIGQHSPGAHALNKLGDYAQRGRPVAPDGVPFCSAALQLPETLHSVITSSTWAAESAEEHLTLCPLQRAVRKAAREGRTSRHDALAAMLAEREAAKDTEVVDNLRRLLKQGGGSGAGDAVSLLLALASWVHRRAGSTTRSGQAALVLSMRVEGPELCALGTADLLATRSNTHKACACAAAAEGHGEQNGRHTPHQNGHGEPQPGMNQKAGLDHEELQAIFKEAVPFRVAEQRLSNLIQSLLVAGCCGITPVLRFIPSAVLWGAFAGCFAPGLPVQRALWCILHLIALLLLQHCGDLRLSAGYFAYMSFASLPGSQFWDRLLLLATDPQQRQKQAHDKGHSFLRSVPFRCDLMLLLLQQLHC